MAEDDDVIRELDHRPLPRRSAQEIAFELITRLGWNDPETLNMLDDYADERLSPDRLGPTADAICQKRSDFDLSRYERSKSCLLACLIPWEGPVDGYYAEHVFDWSKDLGLDASIVANVFRSKMV